MDIDLPDIPGVDDSGEFSITLADVFGFPRRLTSRYSPLRLLGRGGMGGVYLAERLSDGEQVAVKVLRDSHSMERRLRFAREAEALSRLCHPNVLRVLEYGMAGDAPFLVTEYVRGTSLAALPPSPDAVHWMLQVAAALDVVHGAGLVHRDVKPDNVLVRPDGSVVLVDFGLVSMPDRIRLTRTGVVMGTAGFTAPEVLATQLSSRRADWFAWGVTLYFALEGRLPFRAGHVMRAACGDPLPEPEFERISPGGAAAALIRRSLSTDPSLRPSSRRSIELLLHRAPGAITRSLPRLTTEDVRPSHSRWARFLDWLVALLGFSSPPTGR